MHTRIFTIVFWALTLAFVGCRDASTPNGSTTPDFTFIDSYLAKMHQGGGAISINDDETQRFREQLALALSQKDKRAPARIVFYSVRQGVEGLGTIPYESLLGRACYGVFADDVPLVPVQPGVMLVFTEADVYFWWDRHKAEYEAFPPLDAWHHSEHFKNTVIPIYESARRKKPPA